MTEQNENIQPEQPGDNQSDPVAQKLSEMETELADVQNRLLRTAADYQNYVRRAQREMDESRRQELIRVAKAMLPVIDHFDRALEVDVEKATVPSVLQGLKIVHDELLKVMGGLGVERLEAKLGQAFDPNQHEALLRQPAEGVESNHVTGQLQVGYKIGELTIRPAKVSVAP